MPAPAAEQQATREAAFLGHEEVARKTLAFRFARPEGFEHEAGQFAILRLPEGLGLEGEDREHMFTLACAPQDPELLIATRMRGSAWKEALRGLEEGTPVEVDGPDGSFTLHRDATRPAVFLAGGIGVTPFRAMLRDLRARGEERSITLVMSNDTEEDAPFLEELRTLDLDGFRVVATMTEQADWQGERGRVDAAMLRRHLGDLEGPLYYIAGPPGMVRDLRRMLLEAGVPRKDVKVEEFTGY